MKRGFTILEVLVASLLLGMMMSILTMIFSQSSIAWRTGTGSLTDLDDVRMNVAKTRVDADSAYIYRQNGLGQDVLSVLSIWDSRGGSGVQKLRNKRTLTVSGVDYTQAEDIGLALRGQLNVANDSSAGALSSAYSVAGGSGRVKSAVTYTVNVRSAGPNRKHGDYDDIWSYPDDFDL